MELYKAHMMGQVYGRWMEGFYLQMLVASQRVRRYRAGLAKLLTNREW